jgi:hypothetical protein
MNPNSAYRIVCLLAVAATGVLLAACDAPQDDLARLWQQGRQVAAAQPAASAPSH